MRGGYFHSYRSERNDTFRAWCGNRHGFTLLEICTVLFIMVLLLGVTVPAIETAFQEKMVRQDAHEFSLMVKTAMLRSHDENRPYAMEVTGKSLALHPVSAKTDDEKDPGVFVDWPLNSANQLEEPNARQPNAWSAMSPTTWTFTAGELCPVPRIRMTRGKSWLEVSFNALTGNEEDSAAYFP
jgi:hypothetical protein